MIGECFVLFIFMFIAFLLIPVGFFILLKADKIVDNFTGSIGFAEKFLGSGGTYTFMKLFGLLVMIMAFMYLTGGLQWFLEGTIGRFIPGRG